MAVGGLGQSIVVNVGDIIEVRTFCRATDQVGINVFHYRCSGVNGQVTLGMVAANLGASLPSRYKALMSNNAVYDGLDVVRIVPGPRTQNAWSTDGAGAGIVTGDVLPRQVAGVITKLTAFKGRRYRGRFYLAFPCEADSDMTGIPNANYMAALGLLATQFEQLLAPVSGANNAVFIPIVYHRFPGDFTDIVRCRANQKWGTQRKRGSYGRPNQAPTFQTVAGLPVVE